MLREQFIVFFKTFISVNTKYLSSPKMPGFCLKSTRVLVSTLISSTKN